MRRKMWWLAREHRFEPHNIVNIDETMLALLPLPDRAWIYAKRPVQSHIPAGASKLACAVTLACFLRPPREPLAQII
eukprot:3811012-Amphidinium_carterae.1